MKYIISLHGTKGDIIPFVVIAQELKKRGNDVIFLVNDYFSDIINDANLSYLSTGTRENFLQFHKNTHVWNIKKDALNIGFDIIIRRTIEKTFKYVCEICASGDSKDDICVVGIEQNFNGAFWAAELLGLKNVSTFLWPRFIDSDYAPPAPLKWYIPAWFTPSMRLGFLKSIRARGRRYSRSRKYFRDINIMRADRKLKPIESLSHKEIFNTLGLKLGLFPPWYGLPAADWPQNFNLAGFPDPSAMTDYENTAFEQFIAANGPPILFTSGTGVFDTEKIFNEGQKACALLGYPAVFVGGSPPKVEYGAEGKVLHLNYINFEYAFPRCAAVVHHGGIGTLNQALRARVPQLIRPLSFDQPDNADRAKLFGIGSYIQPKKFKARLVAAELQRLMTDPAVRGAIDLYANLAAEKNTTKEVCDLIETYVSQPEIDFEMPIKAIVKSHFNQMMQKPEMTFIRYAVPDLNVNGDHEAVAALLSYKGIPCNLADLHERFAGHMSLANVMQLCREVGLPVRALRVRLESMMNVATPCLIKWQHSRFVLFLGFHEDGVSIYDPFSERNTYTLHEFSWFFSEYVVEIVQGQNT